MFWVFWPSLKSGGFFNTKMLCRRTRSILGSTEWCFTKFSFLLLNGSQIKCRSQSKTPFPWLVLGLGVGTGTLRNIFWRWFRVLRRQNLELKLYARALLEKLIHNFTYEICYFVFSVEQCPATLHMQSPYFSVPLVFVPVDTVCWAHSMHISNLYCQENTTLALWVCLLNWSVCSNILIQFEMEILARSGEWRPLAPASAFWKTVLCVKENREVFI